MRVCMWEEGGERTARGSVWIPNIVPFWTWRKLHGFIARIKWYINVIIDWTIKVYRASSSRQRALLILPYQVEWNRHTQKKTLVSYAICSHLSTFVCSKLVLFVEWRVYDQQKAWKSHYDLRCKQFEVFLTRFCCCCCLALLFNHNLQLHQPMHQPHSPVSHLLSMPTTFTIPININLYVTLRYVGVCVYLSVCVWI